MKRLLVLSMVLLSYSLLVAQEFSMRKEEVSIQEEPITHSTPSSMEFSLTKDEQSIVEEDDTKKSRAATPTLSKSEQALISRHMQNTPSPPTQKKRNTQPTTQAIQEEIALELDDLLEERVKPADKPLHVPVDLPAKEETTLALTQKEQALITQNMNLESSPTDTQPPKDSSSQEKKASKSAPKEEPLTLEEETVILPKPVPATTPIIEENGTVELSQEERALIAQSMQVEESTPSTPPATPLFEPVQGEEFISLRSYINRCMELSHALKEINERALESAQKIKESKAKYYPYGTLTTNVGVKRERSNYLANEKLEEQDDGTMQVVKRAPETTQDSYGAANILISVKQTLYDGGKVKHDVKRREFEKEIVDYNNRGVAEGEVSKFIKAYLDVVFNKMAYDINVNNMHKLKQLQDIIKTKKEAGAASEADESAINANIANAQSSLINVQSRYIDSYDYFKFLLDKKESVAMPFEYKFDIDLNDIDTIINKTKIANYLVLATKQQIEAVKAKRFSTLGETMPQVSLNVYGGRDFTKYTLENTDDMDKTTGSASLKLDYVFADGGNNEAKMQRFQHEYIALTHALNKTIQDETWKVKKIYSSVKSLTDSIKSMDVEIEETKKTLEIFWEKFKIGDQDIQMLLQEQRSYNKVQLKRIKSMSIRTYGFFQILASTGELIPYISSYLQKSVGYYGTGTSNSLTLPSDTNASRSLANDTSNEPAPAPRKSKPAAPKATPPKQSMEFTAEEMRSW
jgi:outer membrane protein TolC